jgi:hypothetical protein
VRNGGFPPRVPARPVPAMKTTDQAPR